MSSCTIQIDPAAPILSLPPELLEPLIRELKPQELHAVSLTCQQLFEYIVPTLRSELVKLTSLENQLIEQFKNLSLVPKTTSAFTAREHADIVIPLYAEVYRVEYGRVRQFVEGGLDNKEIELLFGHTASSLIPALQTVLALPQDSDAEQSEKSSYLYQLLVRMIGDRMTFLAKRIMDQQVELLDRYPSDGTDVTRYQKLNALLKSDDDAALLAKQKRARLCALAVAVTIAVIAALAIGVGKQSPMWLCAYVPATLIALWRAVDA